MATSAHHRGERWPIAVLAALAAFLLKDALFGGRVFFERDIGIWWYGRIAAFARAVAQGAWPLWDPHTAFGKPLLASPGEQVLYPLTWLSPLVSPGTFITVYVAFHLLFTGVGLYLFARRLALSPAASLVAGSLWMLSGPVLSFVNLLHFGGASWIPWVLLATHTAFASPSVRRALALGAALVLPMLAGSVDMCVLSGLVAALYAVRFVDWRTPRSPANLRVAAVGALAVVFGAALSAGAWLPALGVLEVSGRSALGESVRAHWSLHPWSLAQLLAPVEPHTLPLERSLRAALFDGTEPLLFSIYLGACALPLVAAAALGPRRKLAVALGALAVLAGLYALGRHTPVYGALVALLPPLRVLRYPAKAAILLPLAWSLAAGLGFDVWRESGAAWRLRQRLVVALPVLVAVTAVGAALWLALFHADALAARLLDPAAWSAPAAPLFAPTASRLAWASGLGLAALAAVLWSGASAASTGRSAALVAALAVIDLLAAHLALNPTLPRELYERPPSTLDLLDPARPTRVYAFGYGPRLRGRSFRRPPMEDPFELAPDAAVDPRAAKALGLQRYLYYTEATRWAVSSGFGADLQGSAPRYLTNLNLVMWASQETPDFLRLLRVAAVSSVTALHTEGFEELVPRGIVPGPFTRPIRVFAVPDPLPRTYAVGGARIADGLAAYQALVDPGFDPAREIVLPAGEPAAAPSAFSGTSVLREYLSDHVRLEATLDQPGFVVLVDAYDPAWRATVDGVATPLLRANTSFRAVAVPAGRHAIELRYEPRSVRTGLAVSAAALGAALVLVLAQRLRARSASTSRPTSA